MHKPDFSKGTVGKNTHTHTDKHTHTSTHTDTSPPPDAKMDSKMDHGTYLPECIGAVLVASVVLFLMYTASL